MSVITHAEVIARTYTQAPAEQQMPDPLYMAATAAMPPAVKPALEAPRRKPQTQEEAILKLRLEGRNKQQIMEELGVTRQAVERAAGAARKAGVKLPMVREDQTRSGFITRMEDLSGQAKSNMEKAALRYGHSLESYVAARATLVSMRLAMKPMEEISAAIKPTIPEKMLWQWLYNARSGGLDLATRLDYEDAEVVEPQAPPAPVEAPPAPVAAKPVDLLPERVPGRDGPIFTPLDKLEAGALKSVTNAAHARGMTAQSFFDLRESIILHRYNGKGATEIYSLVGQDADFIRNAISNARVKGVRFPPITSRFAATDYAKQLAAAGEPIKAQSGIGRNGRKDGYSPFPLSVKEASPGSLALIKAEGLKPGQTFADYFAVRRKALDMMRTNASGPEIAKTLGITPKQASNWRTRAKAAGLLDSLKVAAE